MAKKDKNNSNSKKNHNNNVSQTDMPDIKTNAQTSNQGASMKQKLNDR